MTRYGRQPRGELARLLDAWQRLESEQQRILRHIFRIIGTHDGSRQPHDGRPVSHDKLLKRIQVAENRRDYKQLVRRLKPFHRYSALIDVVHMYRDMLRGKS